MTTNKSIAASKWALIFKDRLVPMPQRHVDVAVIRDLLALPAEHPLVLDFDSVNDRVLEHGDQVDLGRGNVFHDRLPTLGTIGERGAAKIGVIINDRSEITLLLSMQEEALKRWFGLPPNEILFRDTEAECDVQIAKGATVTFEDGVVFYTESPKPVTVSITINGRAFGINAGRHSVASLKTLAGVAQAEELDQVVGGQLGPLPDNEQIEICGGEQFFSHPRDCASS